jgi:hypothetical protein
MTVSILPASPATKNLLAAHQKIIIAFSIGGAAKSDFQAQDNLAFG